MKCSLFMDAGASSGRSDRARARSSGSHLAAADAGLRDAAEDFDLAEHATGAFGHGAERVVGDVDRQAGLVGRTTTVSKDLSIVLLLTDENCQVAARVEGTNEQGILSGQRVTGNASPELVLNFLSRDANLQPGMKVFTAGVSGAVFPAGIPLGTIKEFRTRELDGQALIEPAADFSALDDVFVVLGSK